MLGVACIVNNFAKQSIPKEMVENLQIKALINILVFRAFILHRGTYGLLASAAFSTTLESD